MWSSQRILIKISGNNGCLAPVLFMYSNHFTIIKKYNFDNKNGIYFFLDLTQLPNFEWWYWIEKHIFLCLSFINIIPMWHPIVDYTSFDNLRSKIFFCSNPKLLLPSMCLLMLAVPCKPLVQILCVQERQHSRCNMPAYIRPAAASAASTTRAPPAEYVPAHVPTATYVPVAHEVSSEENYCDFAAWYQTHFCI